MNLTIEDSFALLLKSGFQDHFKLIFTPSIDYFKYQNLSINLNFWHWSVHQLQSSSHDPFKYLLTLSIENSKWSKPLTEPENDWGLICCNIANKLSKTNLTLIHPLHWPFQVTKPLNEPDYLRSYLFHSYNQASLIEPVNDWGLICSNIANKLSRTNQTWIQPLHCWPFQVTKPLNEPDYLSSDLSHSYSQDSQDPFKHFVNLLIDQIKDHNESDHLTPHCWTTYNLPNRLTPEMEI